MALKAEQIDRIKAELARLKEGGQEAILDEVAKCVVYKDLPTSGSPTTTDVVVQIPEGYPATALDLAGLPRGSSLQARVAGGSNPQGTINADGRSWTLSSYHPHSWPGNTWDQMIHGFDTYCSFLLSWLTRLN